MKRTLCKALSVVLSLLCLLSVAPPAGAAVREDSTVQPAYIGIMTESVSISISSSGCATCTGKINARTGYTATITLTLQRSSNNSTWSTVKTWPAVSGSSLFFARNIYYVSPGYYYRTQATFTVYDSNGNFVECLITSSLSKYY